MIFVLTFLPVRRIVGVGVMILVAVGVPLGVVPFARPKPFPEFSSSLPDRFARPVCAPTARQRLEIAIAIEIAAAVLFVVLRRPRAAQPTVAPA